VRRLARKKAEEANNRVKKYQTEDKLARFKYGRQSAPIQLPELADNGDEMQKPHDEYGTPEYGGNEYS
jgi:hypothetical protein